MSVFASAGHNTHSPVCVCERQWSVTNGRGEENSACFAQYGAKRGFEADYSTIRCMQMRR